MAESVGKARADLDVPIHGTQQFIEIVGGVSDSQETVPAAFEQTQDALAQIRVMLSAEVVGRCNNDQVRLAEARRLADGSWKAGAEVLGKRDGTIQNLGALAADRSLESSVEGSSGRAKTVLSLLDKALQELGYELDGRARMCVVPIDDKFEHQLGLAGQVVSDLTERQRRM